MNNKSSPRKEEYLPAVHSAQLEPVVKMPYHLGRHHPVPHIKEHNKGKNCVIRRQKKNTCGAGKGTFSTCRTTRGTWNSKLVYLLSMARQLDPGLCILKLCSAENRSLNVKYVTVLLKHQSLQANKITHRKCQEQNMIQEHMLYSQRILQYPALKSTLRIMGKTFFNLVK